MSVCTALITGSHIEVFFNWTRSTTNQNSFPVIQGGAAVVGENGRVSHWLRMLRLSSQCQNDFSYGHFFLDQEHRLIPILVRCTDFSPSYWSSTDPGVADLLSLSYA